MLSFIRCSLSCCHQKDGYCSVNTASCVVNSESMGCIYYEPLRSEKSNNISNDKMLYNLSIPIDKDEEK
ncbi:MAG: hypothetical protein K0S55_780 [Clostridia bacterium]|nr:hypothetical protein [Clostridia bacterium]